MSNALIADRDRFTRLHPEQRITLNGREWGYVAIGQRGPVLLLLPGTLGRCDIFWQQIEALEGRARIIALAYPQSGGVAEWADDLAEFFNKRELGDVTLLGSSLGGYLAQYFAAVHPGLTHRLIAANTLTSLAALVTQPPYSTDIDKAPIADIRAGFGKGLRAWSETHPAHSDFIELLLVEAAGRIPEPELRTRLNALKRAPELPAICMQRDRIATVESADDPLMQPAMRASVRDRLNPAVAYRFENGGHFPYLARPALYASLVEEQLGLGVTGDGWGGGEIRAQ